MASIISHALAAVSLGKAFSTEERPARFFVLAALCSILPDADVVGFYFGVRYGDLFGHRGFTHSLAFAFILGCVVASIFFRGARPLSKSWWRLSLFFFIATASHGLLDALTDGGRGVAFFSPFDATRHFFPVRPIQVSPISLGEFFGPWGLAVLLSEAVWIWIPCALLVAAVWAYRRRRRPA